MSNENVEIDFLNGIHEMAEEADFLIEMYTETLNVMETLPENTLPNQEASLALTRMTIMNITMLKSTLLMVTEHSMQVNDVLGKVQERIKKHKENQE